MSVLQPRESFCQAKFLLFCIAFTLAFCAGDLQAKTLAKGNSKTIESSGKKSLNRDGRAKDPEGSSDSLGTKKSIQSLTETRQVTKPANRPVKDKWALIIGISKYAKKELNLKYSDRDAMDFAEYLVNEANFARDHVKILLNEQATQNNILSYMGNKWLPRVAAPDDLVVVFISSHGSSSELDLEGINYILAHDSDPEDLYATGLDMPKLMAMIKARVHSDRIVIIIDACHSGAVRASTKGLSREANVDAAKIAQGTGQLVIASSLPNQSSWEYKQKENSVFTRSLIDGFKCKGNDTSLSDAFSFMKKQVEETVLRERGKLQTPVMESVWEGKSLVLAAPPIAPRAAPLISSTAVRESGNPVDSASKESVSGGIALKPEDKQLLAGKTAAGGVEDDIQEDQVDLKRIFGDEKEEEPQQPRIPSLRAPPLPNRVAIISVSGVSYKKIHPSDYMNDPSIILQSMIRSKLQASLGRRLQDVFSSGAALGRVELGTGSFYDKENVMNLGRACKARFLVDISIESSHFDKQGNCYFATILRMYDGQTGDLILAEGQKADCPKFTGKENEKIEFLKTSVLPGVAEQISESIINVVKFNK